jgi:hypothetical protein
MAEALAVIALLGLRCSWQWATVGFVSYCRVRGARDHGFRTAKAYQVACLNKERQLDVIGVDHVGINLQL